MDDTIDKFYQRYHSFDMWIFYGIITIVCLLIVVSVLTGIWSEWYSHIVDTGINAYVVATVWLLSTISSYITILLLWNDISTDGAVASDYRYSSLYLIGVILTLVWSVTLFQGENISASLWVIIGVNIYYILIFLYISRKNSIASIFMIPTLMAYIYILYVVLHLKYLNNGVE